MKKLLSSLSFCSCSVRWLVFSAMISANRKSNYEITNYARLLLLTGRTYLDCLIRGQERASYRKFGVQCTAIGRKCGDFGAGRERDEPENVQESRNFFGRRCRARVKIRRIDSEFLLASFPNSFSKSWSEPIKTRERA